MMVIWIVLELMFIVMFYRLPSAIENEEQAVVNDSTSKCSSETRTGGLRTKQESESSTCSEECSSTCDSEEEIKIDFKEGRNYVRNNVRHPQVHISTDEKHTALVHSESNETTPLLSSGSANRYSVNKDVGISGSVSVVEKVPDRTSERSPVCSRLHKVQQYVFLVASEMVKEEIVVLLSIMFMTMFSQTAIEVGRIIFKTNWMRIWYHMLLLCIYFPACGFFYSSAFSVCKYIYILIHTDHVSTVG